MSNRATGLFVLLAVVGTSVALGVLVGSRFGSPPVAWAAPDGPLELTPARSGAPVAIDFSDVVEQSLPAVVGVNSTRRGEEEGESRHDRYWPLLAVSTATDRY